MLKFAKKDTSKIAEKRRIEEEAQQVFNEAIDAAQQCLRSEMFNKYKDEYENLTEKVKEQLMFVDMTETDPVKYGFIVKDIIGKWRLLGTLLQGVNQDASKRT